MRLLEETIRSIGEPNKEAMVEAKKIWDSRTHPIGSLGQLEDITIKLAGITGDTKNSINKKGIVVMSADNGIFEENVSSSPQIFTYLLTNAMANGETGVAALAKEQDSEVFVVDIGVIPHGEYIEGVIDKNISHGTKNFAKEPAMSREDAIKAIEVGIELADELFEKGYDILGTGELGIANTTTSSAVLAVLTGAQVKDCVGLGGGIDANQLLNKKRVIEEAIANLNPNKEDPIDILAKVGGLDICGIVGVFLSGAKNKKPVVIDGLISSVAALAANRMNPLCSNYMFASHLSKEIAAKFVLDELGLKPLVTLDMRLGEGSGCPFTFMILNSALFAMENMGTFDSTQIENKKLVNIRDNKIEVDL